MIKECNSNCSQFVLKTQIIKRKVDIDRLTGAYYQQVKNDIKRKIRDDTELLIIKITPKNEISEKCIVDCLMYLQREFTSIITIPENKADMKKEDFKEFEIMYNCTIIYD